MAMIRGVGGKGSDVGGQVGGNDAGRRVRGRGGARGGMVMQRRLATALVQWGECCAW